MAGRLDDALGFYETSMRLRAQRQQVLASNIANADTPNYKACDIDFQQVMASVAFASIGMTQTNATHLPSISTPPMPKTTLRASTQNSQDGNTVDVDVERAAFAENGLQYEASVTLASGQIKNLMAVLQG